ncbi:hypothetical protein pb186bvf_016055 [Paramecium bursaria]
MYFILFRLKDHFILSNLLFNKTIYILLMKEVKEILQSGYFSHEPLLNNDQLIKKEFIEQLKSKINDIDRNQE